MNLPRIAGGSPFAHLRRNNAAVAAKSDEDEEDKEKSKKSKAEDEKDEGEEDKEKSKKSKAEDEKDEDEEDKEKSKKSKAEDEKDEDEEDKEKSKKSKAKRADPEDGDDDSDREDENDSDARAARARERGRFRAIMTSEPGIANPVAAAHLATGTSMPRTQAIEMLAAMNVTMPAATAPRDRLSERMATVKQPEIGAGDPGASSASDPKSLAARIVAADRKARGETA